VKTFQDSKAFQAACKMPPGKRHHAAGEDYRVASSEVVAWLIQQPEILQYVFNKIAHSGAIRFDPSSGTWRGIDG
jgi:hypothetical protein